MEKYFVYRILFIFYFFKVRYKQAYESIINMRQITTYILILCYTTLLWMYKVIKNDLISNTEDKRFNAPSVLYIKSEIM